MKGYLKRNAVFIALFAVILALSASLLCLTVTNGSASAVTAFESEREVEIGHITDTHYYPFRFCYTGDVPNDTSSKDYFYNWIMDKSTKMWLEGEMVFDAGLAKFAANAPDYIVLSGDCAQDGELMGHIDVANKLRRLQNYIRSQGKPDFQIFVVMGNHDLYNPESYRFDNATGTRESFYYTTRMEAVKIYAGLGYPNMTDKEAADFYRLLEADMPDEYGYVKSYLSHAFEYMWQFTKSDAAGKTRVFDPAVDGDEEVTMAKLLTADYVNTFDNGNNLRTQCLSKKNGDCRDLEVGEMTLLASRKDGYFSVIGIDVIMSNAIGEHVLGGEFKMSTREWLSDNQDFARPNREETVMIAIAHHSFVPHWDMEEEVTTGFIMYNWQEGSDFLADYGVRYAYTGHQHANDTASKISFNGNQLIDMESSAHVSVGSQVKITKIECGTVDEKYAEKAYLKAYQNEEIAYDATKANEIVGRNIIVKKLCEKVYANDKHGYVKRNDIAFFIDTENLKILDYSRYAQRRVYDNIVVNYLNKFLQKDITESLRGIVGNIPFVGGFGNDIVKLANNLISEINKKMLSDYTYTGYTERFIGDEDMKIFGYLEDLVRDVLYSPVAEGVSVFDVFMDAYMRHNTGDNYLDVESMPDSYQAVLDKILSGEFVDTLISKLLDERKGLMRIINFLSSENMDLSEGLSTGFKTTLDIALAALSGGAADNNGEALKVDLSNINLGKIIKEAGKFSMVQNFINGLGVQIDLVNMTIPEIVNDIVSKYLTDNFKQGLGEYAYNIISAFAADGGHIDVKNAENGGRLLTVEGRESDYTFINNEKAEIITVSNGKLPSMLTNNFGADPVTGRNFTWFTDRRVSDGVIEYTTDIVNHTNAKRMPAETEIYATTKPLIDLGIWCQSGYIELSRHTVELKGLSENTTYAYRAGSSSNGYWSEWYEFTTASKNGAFEALIASDLQASTKSSYQRIDKIYDEIIEKQFQNGVSFMLNPGDVVDNGRNLSQYQWLYNSSPDIYASYAMVVAAGNHDNKYFDIEKAGHSAAYNGITDIYKEQLISDKSDNADVYYGVNANVMGSENNRPNYNYLWSHYNYVLTDAQNQKSGFYYSFDYSNVHFTVLNTNDIEDNKLAEAQYKWLEADLKATQKAYKVVLMHKSLYSEGSHSFDNEVVGMRAQLTPLFADNGVSLVIAGHDHTYNETFYLNKDGKKVNTDANGKNEIAKDKGTLYVTMGTMGEKFYKWVENKEVPTNTGTKLHKTNNQLSDPTFGKLVFDGEKLYYYGYQYIRSTTEIKGIKKGGLSVGAIVGIVIACVAAAAGATVAVILIVKKKKGAKAVGGEKATSEEITKTTANSAEDVVEEAVETSEETDGETEQEDNE